MKNLSKYLFSIITLLYTIATHAESNAANQCQINGVDLPAAQRFVAELQQAVKKNDKAKVAALVLYPLKINSTSKDKINTITITNKKTFMEKYPQFFTENITKAIVAADVSTIFCNWQGAMVGNGLVWFQSNDKERGFFVINAP